MAGLHIVRFTCWCVLLFTIVDRRHLRSTVASAQELNTGNVFVGREAELSYALEALSAKPPAGLIVLLGTPAVGKTAFLQELSRRLVARGTRVAYVHTRQYRNTRDAAGMAQALAAAAAAGWLPPDAGTATGANLTELASSLTRLASGGLGAGTCGERRRSSSRSRSGGSGGGGGVSRSAPSPVLLEALRLLDATLEASATAAAAAQPAGGDGGDSARGRPVLVIDDAAALKEWNVMQGPSQAALLQWLLYAAAEVGSAHVVLASGDPGFLEWLGGVVSPVHFSTEVLGELSPPESLGLLRRLVPPEQHEALAANISSIHEACGGNPGVLQRCAAFFRGDWRQAALRATKDVRMRVRAALTPLPSDGWARWQFAKAVNAVLSDSGGGVGNGGVGDGGVSGGGGGGAEHAALAEALGRNGAWVLRTIASKGLFSLRPYSTWQHDVPAAAWARGAGAGGAAATDDDGVVVVAGSGAALYGMRRLRMPPAEELAREEEASEGRRREYRREEARRRL